MTEDEEKNGRIPAFGFVSCPAACGFGPGVTGLSGFPLISYGFHKVS